MRCSHYAHGEAELKSTHTHEECDDSRVYDPHRLLMNSFMQLPFPSSERVAYFLVHAPDLRSLVVSKRRGVWRAPLRTIADMNHAITVMGEKPLLFFSVGPLKGIYGVATLAAPIPVPPAPAQAAEFEVKWLRCMRVSAKVVTISKVTIALGGGRYPDYKMERGVGYELMLIAFRKPEWDWSADADKIQPFATAANASLPEGVLFGEDWVAGGRDGPPPPPRRPPDLPPPAPPRALPPAQLDYYTGDIPGFVVVAMPAMLEETFARLLFGMPPQTMELAARHIVVNTPLFLLDSQNQLLYGIFQSTSGAGDSIVPGAFRGGSARSDAFPVQTRFAVALECPPVAEADKELRQALAGRALGVGPLSLRETRAVANVLAARAGFFSGPARPFHEEHRPHRDGGGGGGSSFYKPPFGFVDGALADCAFFVAFDVFVVVYINLPASPFEIKKMSVLLCSTRLISHSKCTVRRVLGQDAFKVLEIINALGPRSIKIRIRGVGSGFKEGPGQQELPEPLHLNVCAESEELLRLAVARVHVLVEGARMELLSQGR